MVVNTAYILDVLCMSDDQKLFTVIGGLTEDEGHGGQARTEGNKDGVQ